MLRYGGSASVFRYGGEEFTLLFKGRNVEQAEETLEQVREEIQAQRLDVSTDTKTKEISVTASLGLAYSAAGDAPGDVIKRADQALYQAKRKGRNRLMVAAD